METFIVLVILLAVVFLAARSIYRTRKRGGCSGNCANCPSCSGRHSVSKPSE